MDFCTAKDKTIGFNNCCLPKYGRGMKKVLKNPHDHICRKPCTIF